MEDDGGLDDKIIAVPTNKIDPFQSEICDLDDLNDKIKERISHFFEHYKDLEKDKWVKLIGWGNKNEALDIIKESIENFIK
jgi:inorganic pyrophosphatase